jgi:hypothetical protein
MRPLLAALLLLPAVGTAQTLSVTINSAITYGTNVNPVLAFNASGCSSNITGSWTGTGLTTACTSLQLWITNTTCAATPNTTVAPVDYIFYTQAAGNLVGGLTTDTFSFTASVLPGFAAGALDGGNTSCGSVNDFTNYVCGAVTLNTATSGCTGTVVQPTTINGLRYDNVPPDPPTINIVPLDSQLSVRLSPDALTPVVDVQYYLVQYALQSTDGGTYDGGTLNYTPVGGNIAASNAAVSISNLVNGDVYSIQGFTVDEASNVSTTPTTVTGSPVMTTGFYANYLNDGGQVGGCGDSAGGAPSALALGALLALVLARRRG